MRRLVALSVLPFFLAACPASERPADEGPYCEDTRSAVAFDEVTAIGLSANDVLAGVPADEDTVLRYADGALTDLHLGFAPGAEAFFVDSEAVYPDYSDGSFAPDIAVLCEDRVEIAGAFTFETADAAFTEAFDGVLAADVNGTRLSQQLDLDALEGSFDIAPFVDAEDYTDLRAWIDVFYVDGASVGSVEGQASGEDECDGDECSAWAVSVPVGTWPAEGAE